MYSTLVTSMEYDRDQEEKSQDDNAFNIRYRFYKTEAIYRVSAHTLNAPNVLLSGTCCTRDCALGRASSPLAVVRVVFQGVWVSLSRVIPSISVVLF